MELQDAMQSRTVENMIDDGYGGDGPAIPFPNLIYPRARAGQGAGFFPAPPGGQQEGRRAAREGSWVGRGQAVSRTTNRRTSP